MQRARTSLRLAALILAAILATALPASADPIADKKAEAVRLQKKIAELRKEAERMAEQYNKARHELGLLDVEVKVAESDVAARIGEADALTSNMSKIAARSYVYGTGDALPIGVILEDDTTARSAYLATLTGDINDTIDSVNAARDDAAKQQRKLEAAQAKKKKLIADTEARRIAAEKAAKKTDDTLAKVNADVKELVRLEEIRVAKEAEAKAERERQARLAQERLVRERAARAPQGSTAKLTPLAPEAPATSPAAARVVAAARSQLGVPYVWAANSPGRAMDCSGLTQYAWGTVGVGMAHYTVTQWNAFPKVPFGQEQPGDLVFFGRDLHHVGLYVGNGQMIHAPYTGTVVQYAYAFGGDYVGAVRPG